MHLFVFPWLLALVCLVLRTDWAAEKMRAYECEGVGARGNKLTNEAGKLENHGLCMLQITSLNWLSLFKSGLKIKDKFRWIFLYYVERNLVNNFGFNNLIELLKHLLQKTVLPNIKKDGLDLHCTIVNSGMIKMYIYMYFPIW